MRSAIAPLAAAALFILATGCSTAPKTAEEKRSLEAEADATVMKMTAKDPSLRDFINRGHGYAVFPDIGKAGAIVGGAYGRGVVFEQGQPIGFAELNQGSIGAQIGGQSYSELIVFENEAALNRLKAGNFDMGAELSAVAIKAGAAGATHFEGGMAVFQLPRGGLMAAAAINGQKINFQPRDHSATAGDRPSTTRSSTEMQIRTDRSSSERLDDASDSAQQATDRTERRIEERRQELHDTTQNPR